MLDIKLYNILLLEDDDNMDGKNTKPQKPSPYDGNERGGYCVYIAVFVRSVNFNRVIQTKMGRDVASERYKVLVCACLLTFGSYYCFDMPSVLETQITYTIIDRFEPDKGATLYNLFYAVYSWTNMATSLLAGLLVDKYGVVPAVFLFLSFASLDSRFGLTGHPWSRRQAGLSLLLCLLADLFLEWVVAV